MEKLNKAEIAKQLRTMVEERLFGAKPWPIDNNYEVRQQLIDWGLVEKIGSNIHTTALGCELSVDTWSAFIGHHEPFEVPDILAQMGMITEEEADHIVLDRWEARRRKARRHLAAAPPPLVSGSDRRATQCGGGPRAPGRTPDFSLAPGGGVMTIHTPSSVRAARRRLTHHAEQLEEAGAVLAEMQAGSTLHPSFTRSGLQWVLSNGRRVPVDVAELVTASASVTSAGDALFEDATPQTWRWWKAAK